MNLLAEARSLHSTVIRSRSRNTLSAAAESNQPIQQRREYETEPFDISKPDPPGWLLDRCGDMVAAISVAADTLLIVNGEPNREASSVQHQHLRQPFQQDIVDELSDTVGTSLVTSLFWWQCVLDHLSLRAARFAANEVRKVPPRRSERRASVTALKSSELSLDDLVTNPHALAAGADTAASDSAASPLPLAPDEFDGQDQWERSRSVARRASQGYGFVRAPLRLMSSSSLSTDSGLEPDEDAVRQYRKRVSASLSPPRQTGSSVGGLAELFRRLSAGYSHLFMICIGIASRAGRDARVHSAVAGAEDAALSEVNVEERKRRRQKASQSTILELTSTGSLRDRVCSYLRALLIETVAILFYHAYGSNNTDQATLHSEANENAELVRPGSWLHHLVLRRRVARTVDELMFGALAPPPREPASNSSSAAASFNDWAASTVGWPQQPRLPVLVKEDAPDLSAGPPPAYLEAVAALLAVTSKPGPQVEPTATQSNSVATPRFSKAVSRVPGIPPLAPKTKSDAGQSTTARLAAPTGRRPLLPQLSHRHAHSHRSDATASSRVPQENDRPNAAAEEWSRQVRQRLGSLLASLDAKTRLSLLLPVAPSELSTSGASVDEGPNTGRRASGISLASAVSKAHESVGAASVIATKSSIVDEATGIAVTPDTSSMATSSFSAGADANESPPVQGVSESDKSAINQAPKLKMAPALPSAVDTHTFDEAAKKSAVASGKAVRRASISGSGTGKWHPASPILAASVSELRIRRRAHQQAERQAATAMLDPAEQAIQKALDEHALAKSGPADTNPPSDLPSNALKLPRLQQSKSTTALKQVQPAGSAAHTAEKKTRATDSAEDIEPPIASATFVYSPLIMSNIGTRSGMLDRALQATGYMGDRSAARTDPTDRTSAFPYAHRHALVVHLTDPPIGLAPMTAQAGNRPASAIPAASLNLYLISQFQAVQFDSSARTVKPRGGAVLEAVRQSSRNSLQVSRSPSRSATSREDGDGTTFLTGVMLSDTQHDDDNDFEPPPRLVLPMSLFTNIDYKALITADQHRRPATGTLAPPAGAGVIKPLQPSASQTSIAARVEETHALVREQSTASLAREEALIDDYRRREAETRRTIQASRKACAQQLAALEREATAVISNPQARTERAAAIAAKRNADFFRAQKESRERSSPPAKGKGRHTKHSGAGSPSGRSVVVPDSPVAGARVREADLAQFAADEAEAVQMGLDSETLRRIEASARAALADRRKLVKMGLSMSGLSASASAPALRETRSRGTTAMGDSLGALDDAAGDRATGGGGAQVRGASFDDADLAWLERFEGEGLRTAHRETSARRRGAQSRRRSLLSMEQSQRRALAQQRGDEAADVSKKQQPQEGKDPRSAMDSLAATIAATGDVDTRLRDAEDRVARMRMARRVEGVLGHMRYATGSTLGTSTGGGAVSFAVGTSLTEDRVKTFGKRLGVPMAEVTLIKRAVEARRLRNAILGERRKQTDLFKSLMSGGGAIGGGQTDAESTSVAAASKPGSAAGPKPSPFGQKLTGITLPGLQARLANLHRVSDVVASSVPTSVHVLNPSFRSVMAAAHEMAASQLDEAV